jgi:hypothetical protein
MQEVKKFKEFLIKYYNWSSQLVNVAKSGVFASRGVNGWTAMEDTGDPL